MREALSPLEKKLACDVIQITGELRQLERRLAAIRKALALGQEDEVFRLANILLPAELKESK